MTKIQKIIIIIFAFLFIAVLLVAGVLIWPDVSSILILPTQVIYMMPVSTTEISFPNLLITELPTSTPTLYIPTPYIKKPTWTPIPTITPWPSPARIPSTTLISTTTPNQTSVAPIPSVKPDCSAQYNYIEAVHQYYLNYINSVYNQQLAYYQSLLEQAIRARDASTAIQIEQTIKQVKANRAAAIKNENARYESDKAYLDSICQ